MRILQRNLRRIQTHSSSYLTQRTYSCSNFVVISSLLLELFRKCRFGSELDTLYNKLVIECVTPGLLWLPVISHTTCRGYMYELRLKKEFGVEHMIQQSATWWLHSLDITARFSLIIRKSRSKRLWNSGSADQQRGASGRKQAG